MPNYKLSQALQGDLIRQVAQITARRVEYAQDGFPLTHDDVQRACLSDEQLEHMRWLDNDGVKNLPTDGSPQFAVHRDDVPIKRNVVLTAYVPTQVFAYGRSFYISGSVYRDKDVTSKCFLDPSRMDDTTVVKLAEWIDGVVKELRLQEVTTAVVAWMLDKNLPTTGHLLVRWPTLATLVEDKEWKSRLRHPPVRTKQYAWPRPLEGHRMMALKAADAVLLGGSMLPPHTNEANVVRGAIRAWERLPNDKSFS